MRLVNLGATIADAWALWGILNNDGRSLSFEVAQNVVSGELRDPFSVEELTQSWTSAGRTHQYRYDAETLAIEQSSPLGITRTTEMDEDGRVLRVTQPGVPELTITYNELGFPLQQTRSSGTDSRSTTLTYDALARVDRVTDALARETSFEYDEGNRLIQTTLPDTETFGLAYDLNSNLTSFTPPGRPAYQFTYTPTNLIETVALPVTADGPAVSTFIYNHDQQPESITYPSGEVVSYEYDRQRLDKIVESRGETQYTYEPLTSKLTQITDPAGNSKHFTYDGPLQTSHSWQGEVEAEVSVHYGPDLRLNTETVTTGIENSTIAYSWTDDDQLSSAGSMAISHDPTTGFVTTTQLGQIQTSYSYSDFAEQAAITTSYNGTPIFSEVLTYDDLGLVSSISRTKSGITTSRSFSYDSRNRLLSVTTDGTQTGSYTYDANSNRVSYTGQFGTSAATYDARDRILTHNTKSL